MKSRSGAGSGGFGGLRRRDEMMPRSIIKQARCKPGSLARGDPAPRARSGWNRFQLGVRVSHARCTSYSIKDGNSFAQWYNTTANVNQEIPGQLTLTETPAGSGISMYDSTAFFPIDGKGFGNTPGQTHNYSFTTEIHVTFTYQAKQKFTFRGDDDLWIFVNHKLALDVGGQHQALEGTIDFDLQAAALGITVGSSYSMDIFHAERQTTDSNFRIETNITCFVPSMVVK